MTFCLKSINNPSTIDEKPTEIDQIGTRERSESGSGKRSILGPSQGERRFEKWGRFWRHSGDFGRHFGASGAGAGSQNRAFWDKNRKNGFPKRQKTMPKKYRKIMPKAPKMMPKSMIFHAFTRKAKTLETICFTI